jgi:hypothetical protein
MPLLAIVVVATAADTWPPAELAAGLGKEPVAGS